MKKESLKFLPDTLVSIPLAIEQDMSLLSILSPNSTKSLPAPHLSTPKFSAQAATKLHTFRSPPSTKIPAGPSLDDYTPMLHPAESYMHDRAKYSEMK
jgi:hypothetical protein